MLCFFHFLLETFASLLLRVAPLSPKPTVRRGFSGTASSSGD